MFMMGSYVREMTVKKSCNYGEYGLLEHLLFFVFVHGYEYHMHLCLIHVRICLVCWLSGGCIFLARQLNVCFTCWRTTVNMTYEIFKQILLFI